MQRSVVLLLLALVALAGAPELAAAAQGQVQVSARLSAGVLRMGDTGALNVTVENAEDARVLDLPVVEGLRFGRPGQPMAQHFSGFVNGRRYSESNLKIAIPFRAEAEGDFTIPAIAIEVDGQRHETKPLRITIVEDISGADFGYIEARPSGTKVVEGQPFTVELVFGWDEERSGKVTFAELNLPWWDSLPGAIEVEARPIPQTSRVDLPVNGSLQVPAEQLENRVREGRSFITLRLTKSFLPTRSGTLEFPTSFFEFGRLRQTSFFDSRRESHFVQAPPFTVEVVALPSAGQPLDFSGAVGTIAARASADTRDVRAGDSIKFTVEWTGQGNLEYFRAPDPGALDAFRGFRVYGAAEEKSFERRKVVYDLAPLSSEVQAIPALPLSVYDPESARYETVATAPIPIRVRALEKGAGLDDAEKHFERDIADIDAGALAGGGGEDGSARDLFLLGALVTVPLAGFCARARARARAGDPGAPLERRRRRAAKAFARALERADGPAAQLAALQEFLAARTREQAEAWNGRDFARWAAERAPRLPADAVRETTRTLAGLEAAVYGGREAPPPERIRTLARELQEASL